MTAGCCDGQCSSSPRALSHVWPGLFWGCSTQVAAVQDRFPNFPQLWQLTRQLPKDNTQEKKVKVSCLQAGWNHVTMEKGAPGAAPPLWCKAHPRADARQRCSPFPTTTVAPQNILSSRLLLTAPHIYQDAAASLGSHPLHQRHLREVPSPPQRHRKRDCRIHADNFEKQWASHPYRLAGVVGAEMTFVLWLGQTRPCSPRTMLESKVWVRPWMFIHIFVLIQECEGCSSLTTNSHGMHWNCQSL